MAVLVLSRPAKKLDARSTGAAHAPNNETNFKIPDFCYLAQVPISIDNLFFKDKHGYDVTFVIDNCGPVDVSAYVHTLY